MFKSTYSKYNDVNDIIMTTTNIEITKKRRNFMTYKINKLRVPVILKFIIARYLKSILLFFIFSFSLSICAQIPKGLKEKAEAGDAKSQLQLGELYISGKQIPKDYKKAVVWFKKAADQDNSKAQFRLGLCYQLGTGVKKILKKQ